MLLQHYYAHTSLAISLLCCSNYRCYETCSLLDDDNGTTVPPRCEARVSGPDLHSTLLVSGPYHLRQYSVHQLQSPSTQTSQLYPNNHLCK